MEKRTCKKKKNLLQITQADLEPKGFLFFLFIV